MIKITNGAVIRNGSIEKTNIYVEGGKIKKIILKERKGLWAY